MAMPNGVCGGSGLASSTNVPAFSKVGLPPLQQVSLSYGADIVTVVLEFTKAPPSSISGVANVLFVINLGSSKDATGSLPMLDITAGGLPVGPDWISTPISATVDASPLSVAVDSSQ